MTADRNSGFDWMTFLCLLFITCGRMHVSRPPPLFCGGGGGGEGVDEEAAVGNRGG